MAWAEPSYERKEVDSAGKLLACLDFPVTTFEGIGALTVINNWRSSHSYPLNTFQMTLRKKARKIERKAIVAQRIKRLESIHAKLHRQPSMRMTQMQDIAGCRAVMGKMSSVKRLVQNYKTARFEHKFKSEKDYISNPKPDGYRCYHLVYTYQGTVATKAYTGLQIEIQIRTQMQHAWATAVEAVGIFTRQALKSNQGDQDWLRFFALMGAAIAAIEECQPVPDTPTDKGALVTGTKLLADKLNVQKTLKAYKLTIEYVTKQKDAKYFILQLNAPKETILVWSYKALESEAANAKYTELEGGLEDNSTMQVVLVSADNINALKRAYPNYFLDTDVFSALVERVLTGDFPNPRPQNTTLIAS